MQKLGHNWVDVFKIDVEGSEYETFAAIAALKDGMRFTQLQVEVHLSMGAGWVKMENGNREALKMLYGLMSNGFRTMSLEPNIYSAGQTCMEFGLIRLDDCGNVFTPTFSQ
jgi:hypothetical protein